MANLRIIYDNAADRGIVSVPVGGTALSADYLLTEKKSEFHRSTTTTVRYRVTWADGETVAGIGLPAMNISAEATMRSWLYSDTDCTLGIADTGLLDAVPGMDMDLWDWDGVLNANAFSWGGVAKTAMWFDAVYFARGCEIEISDPTNPAGYIDNARLVIGPYWEPAKGASFGAQVYPRDATVNSRNDAQDNLSDLAGRHDVMAFDLKLMPEADRQQLIGLFLAAGVGRNLFISLEPGNGMNVREQQGLIYGKRANSPIGYDFAGAHSTKFEVEGW